MRTLVVTPDVLRRRRTSPSSCAALRAAAARRRRPRRRRQQPRRHRRHRRARRRAELGQIDVLRRPAKNGLGSAYRAGFAIGLDRGYDVARARSTPTSRTTPPRSPTLLGAIERRRRPRDRLAVRARRRDPALALVPAGAVSRYGNLYARVRARDGRHATPRRATAPTARDDAQGHRLRHAARKGYGFQIELAYRVCAVAAGASPRCRSCSPTGCAATRR